METVQIECRCKDCKYYIPSIDCWGENDYLYPFGWCNLFSDGVNEDDFCSNGIRKKPKYKKFKVKIEDYSKIIDFLESEGIFYE